MKLLLLSIMFLGMSFTHASEGNGSTGGGHIYGDQLNPWFIQNTKNVNYCVEIAPEFSQLPRGRVLELIKNSFSFWKKTFSGFPNFIPVEISPTPVMLSQEFIFKENCSDTIDIVFQMGFLTPAQELSYPNYKQIIGKVGRTHYDEQNLKGRGFIYIAPEEGRFRPSSPNFISRPWSSGKNLKLQMALMHELGHVFGLQDDYYGTYGLMNARFVDMITHKKSPKALENNIQELATSLGCNIHFDGSSHHSFRRFTLPPIEVEEEKNGGDDINEILNLPDQFTLDIKSKNKMMTIRMNNKLFGTIKLNHSSFNSAEDGGAIHLFLTKKQKVFNKVPAWAYESNFPFFQIFKSVVRKDEVLKLNNNEEIKVFINYNQFCKPSIGSVYKGKLYLDIFTGI